MKDKLTTYFSKLFDHSDFMPRYSCGPGWTQDLVDQQLAANLLIFGAYMVVPFMISVMVHSLITGKRKTPPFPMTGTVALGFFIFCCGLSHLSDFFMFSKPMYRFDTLLRMLTAGASWSFVLWGIISITVLKWNARLDRSDKPLY